MTADVSELTAFADLLRAAAGDAATEGRQIVAKGSLNIKTRARELAPSGGHARHYPASISYDILGEADDIIGEVGPVQGRRQRGLGNLLEYGSPNNPPHPHHEPALDEEAPRFYAAAEALAARLMERY